MRRAMLLLVACVASAAAPERGLVVLDELPTTLNPLYARTLADHRAQEILFHRLWRRTPIDSTMTSRLVERYGWGGLGAAARAGSDTFVLELQERAWGDGEKVGADDVCFTIAVVLEPKNAIPWADRARREIAGCEVRGEREVAIRFARPPWHPQEALAIPILPAHAFTSTVIPEDHPFGRDAIGSTGFRGRLDADGAHFAAARPAGEIDRVDILPMPAPEEAVRRLLAGEVHGVVDLPVGHRAAVAQSDAVALKAYDLRTVWFVAVNTKRAPLHDASVREGLDRCLDRDAARRALEAADPDDPNPTVELLSGPFVQRSPYYDRQIRPTPHDATAGARLLPDDLSLRLARGPDAMPGLADVLASQWKACGVAVEVVPAEAKDADLAIRTWSVGDDEDVSLLLGTGGRANRFGWSDERTDELLQAHRTATTAVAARDAYHALHAHVAEVRPILPLWQRDTNSAWRREVQRNVINPSSYWTLLELWRVEP